MLRNNAPQGLRLDYNVSPFFSEDRERSPTFDLAQPARSSSPARTGTAARWFNALLQAIHAPLRHRLGPPTGKTVVSPDPRIYDHQP